MGVLFKFKNILFGNRVLFLGLIVVKKESVTGKTQIFSGHEGKDHSVASSPDSFQGV